MLLLRFLTPQLLNLLFSIAAKYIQANTTVIINLMQGETSESVKVNCKQIPLLSVWLFVDRSLDSLDLHFNDFSSLNHFGQRKFKFFFKSWIFFTWNQTIFSLFFSPLLHSDWIIIRTQLLLWWKHLLTKWICIFLSLSLSLSPIFLTQQETNEWINIQHWLLFM